MQMLTQSEISAILARSDREKRINQIRQQTQEQPLAIVSDRRELSPMPMQYRLLEVYCDGSADQWCTEIGWGWINEHGQTARGGWNRHNMPNQVHALSSNIAELVAVYYAIVMHPEVSIKINTDSEYAMQVAYFGRSPRKESHQSLSDAIKRNILLRDEQNLLTQFKQIKGHVGNRMHNKAHRLANRSRKESS